MESLEIIIQSASRLKDLNTIGTMDPYVLVTLSSDPKSVQKTDVALYGGTNPKWRSKAMRFDVNEDMCKTQNVTLVFKIMAEKAFGDKEVGVVVLLVRELFEVEQMAKSLISCTVSTPSGRPKGTLNFSYKYVKNAMSNKNVCERNVSGGYFPPKAIESGTSSNESDLYPPPPLLPQSNKEVAAAPYPPPSLPPHNPQPEAGYLYPPPQQAGYPPQSLQGYAHAPPPLVHYQQQPVGYYPYPPPPHQGYAPQPPPGYAYTPSNQQVKVKELGGKPKSKRKKEGWLIGAASLAGAMLLGVDVGSSLGGTADAGSSYYNYNDVLQGHYGSIGSAIG